MFKSAVIFVSVSFRLFPFRQHRRGNSSMKASIKESVNDLAFSLHNRQLWRHLLFLATSEANDFARVPKGSEKLEKNLQSRLLRRQIVPPNPETFILLSFAVAFSHVNDHAYRNHRRYRCGGDYHRRGFLSAVPQRQKRRRIIALPKTAISTRLDLFFFALGENSP